MIIVKDMSKDTLLKAINAEKITIQGLTDILGSIKEADKAVRSDLFDYIKRNAVINSISEKAKKEVSSRADFFETLTFACNNAQLLLTYIENYFKKAKNNVYDTETITYKEKGMFDWFNAINFFGRHSTTLLNIILEQPKSINAYLAKVDFEFINKTYSYYSILIKRLCDSERNLYKSIEMLSDETYDIEGSEIIESIKGKQAVSVGFAPHQLNPVFWIRMGIMKHDVKVIKRNREEIDVCVAKIQKLESRKNGNPDPALEKQIEFWENEIRILNAEIAEKEDKYA